MTQLYRQIILVLEPSKLYTMLMQLLISIIVQIFTDFVLDKLKLMFTAELNHCTTQASEFTNLSFQKLSQPMVLVVRDESENSDM